MSFTVERVAQLNKQRLSNPSLKPELVRKVQDLIDFAEEKGFTLLVVLAFRTIAEQDALYAQGRTKKGRIVTNAKGMQSKHCQGKACDLAFIINGEVSWDWQYYERLGAWAKSFELTWGGNFKSIKDGDHVEIA